jgi:YVTN family beta-propeller protein
MFKACDQIGALRHRRMRCLATFVGVMLTMAGAHAQVTNELLQPEAKIALGNVTGRIDHMAIDEGRGRLFVAELGNNSVGVVDLDQRKVIHRITGLQEPQGVGFLAVRFIPVVALAWRMPAPEGCGAPLRALRASPRRRYHLRLIRRPP